MSSKYTAVIIEPRQHKALSFVLNNFLENLNDDWNIIIFHGKNNYNFLVNIVETQINYKYKPRIKFINLGIENLTIKDYNNILKSPIFYGFIPTETFMIFQTDSMIIPKYKHYIDLFLNYDYVGAPWDDGFVGNGGLSIRKKSKMLKIIYSHNFKKKTSFIYKKNDDDTLPEDVFFSLNKYIQLVKPTFEQAKLFSMEQIFSEKGSFGVHKPWNRINDELLKSHCEDILTLKNLQ